MRILNRKDTFAWPDIQKLIQNNDLSDPDTFLVLNGGTGVGKTSSVMSKVQLELEKKFNHTQSMLVVESRTATVDQINTNYTDYIEKMNGVDVCQRLSFMRRIETNSVYYDWVVIDECHGLFSEAIFAEDAEAIASWIKVKRKNTHIIFVTANDEYFDTLSKKYFPEKYSFIYLFPDFTSYVSNTYVKEIQFIKTNRINNVINTLLLKGKGKKGIIFLKRASDVKDWYFRCANMGLNSGMIVSQANVTSANLTPIQSKQMQDFLINISNGQAGITMADLCQVIDKERERNNKESIRSALNNERLPDDIDILFATDTIQEGISIKSNIDYIIIEGYTEVEVRQKLGRFRGNLESLFIIFNPISARNRLMEKINTFNELIELEKANNQIALAKFYGIQIGAKFVTYYLKEYKNIETGKPEYHINAPALLNCRRELETYNMLLENTDEAVKNLYSYPLLTGAPKIIDYNDDIRAMDFERSIQEIAEKWVGIPLKGKAQNELVEDFKLYSITDKTRRPIDSFKRCIAQLEKYGITIIEKQAGKKELAKWPQYLSKAREKYKIIVL